MSADSDLIKLYSDRILALAADMSATTPLHWVLAAAVPLLAILVPLPAPAAPQTRGREKK